MIRDCGCLKAQMGGRCGCRTSTSGAGEGGWGRELVGLARCWLMVLQMVLGVGEEGLVLVMDIASLALDLVLSLALRLERDGLLLSVGGGRGGLRRCLRGVVGLVGKS